MTDKVPDHSTISWNRRIRFNVTDIFQKIFDEIVLQAISHRMVGERVLVTDSTHVKANANKHQYTKQLSKYQRIYGRAKYPRFPYIGCVSGPVSIA